VGFHPSHGREISPGVVGYMDLLGERTCRIPETVALAQAANAEHHSQPLQFGTTVVPCVLI